MPKVPEKSATRTAKSPAKPVVLMPPRAGKYKRQQKPKAPIIHSVPGFTDDDIIKAYQRVSDKIKHTDAMTIEELALIRSQLVGDNEWLCLHKLRNRVVQLRKGTKLKK